jgi:hypothetical protein
MAKRQQMRWTDEGAHCMAQVRVEVLNKELSPRRILALKAASSIPGNCVGQRRQRGPINGSDPATLRQARAT